MLPSSHHPNLTPMGTVPISVIYGFEYPLNGSESRTKTKGESLHTSGENKKINPLPSVASVRKTKGCLSNLQRPQKRTGTGINQQYFPLQMCITKADVWYKWVINWIMLCCSGTTVSLTLRGAEPAPGGGESARKSRGCLTDIKKYRRPNFISAASRHPICRWATSGQYWEHSGINTDKN